MMGGISIHVIDVTRGRPATGMKVEVFRLGDEFSAIATGVLSSQGTLEHPIAQGEGVDCGIYEVVFHVGDFYRKLGHLLPDLPFLDTVPFRFGISDVEQHYHLPLKVSPWGLSLFRGG
ncbi:MAG: hydroxyisourate hydrolase [Elainellaceae cyanobacterium]